MTSQDTPVTRTKLTISLGGNKASAPAGERPKHVSGKASQGVVVEVKRSRGRMSDHDATPMMDTGLTRNEQDKRLRVLQEAAVQAQQRELAAAQEAKKQESEKALLVPASLSVDEEAPAITETPVVVAPLLVPDLTENQRSRDKKARGAEEEDKEAVAAVKGEKHDPKASFRQRSDLEARRQAKVSIHTIHEQEIERVRSLSSLRRARAKLRGDQRGNDAEKVHREVILPETITVQELSNRMAERGADVIRELMKLGVMASLHQTIDADTAELVIDTMGHSCRRVAESDVENILERILNHDDAPLASRPPVVTIMGHVDHGKTSLLDAIRSTAVTEGEAGGITQHIGAYQVTTADNHVITFLDTPGHEAFTAMRARGAKVTDIVVIVVAADDGIMAQTIEAINHAKAANVPIIVAINKIDKPDANPARVKNELLSHSLVSEELGGDVMMVEVSAKEHIGLDKLLESILLQAEMMQLTAHVDCSARGTVIESRIEKGLGVVCTMLIQEGYLHTGDILLAGTAYGRVRAMSDDKGQPVTKAIPSMPVEIVGLTETPSAGDLCYVVETEKHARDICDYRRRTAQEKRTARVQRTSLEELFAKANDTSLVKELPIIVKGDVHGSIEAIQGTLATIGNEEVRLRVIHAGIGGITESDITLAAASHALVIGFNVRPTATAREAAATANVDMRFYSIIYDVIDDMKAILQGMLSPTIREIYMGTVQIRQVFTITKVGKVAGGYVIDGTIQRGAGVRLLRDDVVIYTGRLKTLRRFKDDVKEVRANTECGLAFENYDDIREGDKVEAFSTKEEQKSL